jgi:hypothetical protein
LKRRVQNEAFYTDRHIAQMCVSRVNALVSLETFDVIVEPSAGDGAFLCALPTAGTIGLDIAPAGPGIHQQDFLAWQPPNTANRILVIGNPPFGQRASLAMKFIRHAAQFADTIAFMLPRSFNKETFHSQIPSRFHLVDSVDIDGPFLRDSMPMHVKTVFQVWQQANTPRQILNRPRTHPDFRMTHAHLSRVSPERLDELRTTHDFVIPQVGSTFHPRNIHEVGRGSQWFIKAHFPGVQEIFARADYAFLSNMNTAHTSLSRADIVQAYSAAKIR